MGRIHRRSLFQAVAVLSRSESLKYPLKTKPVRLSGDLRQIFLYGQFYQPWPITRFEDYPPLHMAKFLRAFPSNSLLMDRPRLLWWKEKSMRQAGVLMARTVDWYGS